VNRSSRGGGASTAARDEGGRSESIARKLYSGLAALLAAAIARMIVKRLWVKTTGKIPPEQPESPQVHWAEAVGWSALSGTSVAVARLLASRRAAGAWKRVSDESPTMAGSGRKR
jgi:NhaP-type Na+/H+ or K+/H+ antiporter